MRVGGERDRWCQIMWVDEAEERVEDGIFFCLGMQKNKGEEEVEG